MVHDRATVTMADQHEVLYDLLFSVMFNNLEWPNTHFKVMPIFDTEMSSSQSSRFYKTTLTVVYTYTQRLTIQTKYRPSFSTNLHNKEVTKNWS